MFVGRENELTELQSELKDWKSKTAVLEYFHRQAVGGVMEDIEDFGCYWYDDPVNKSNGEFDCVVKRVGEKYDFYECKFFDRKMTAEECKQEQKQLEEIKGITADRVGFVSVEGFSSKKIMDYVLLDGKMLYK
ncbi:MAG: hypothetical protein IK138_02660 [Lachnospiraceae bacterium]|nr:hypothetical protein [Lachnospiraceae bacterium]